MFCIFKSSAYSLTSCKSSLERLTITGSINILSSSLNLSNSFFICAVRFFLPSFSNLLYLAINSWNLTPKLSTEFKVDLLGVWNNLIKANKSCGLLLYGVAVKRITLF